MKKAANLLLEAGSLPDNLEAYLRRVLESLRAADAGGPGAGAAVILSQGTLTPRVFLAAGFTKAETAAFGRKGIDGLERDRTLSAAVRGGDAEGVLALRPSAGAQRAQASRALAAAARAVSARLAGENRELLLIKERDTADAAAHLEEVLLSMPELSLAEISRAVLDEARRLTDSPSGFAGYVSPETGKITLPALEGVHGRGASGGIAFDESHGLWGRMLESKAPAMSNCPPPLKKAARYPKGHPPLLRFAGAPALAGAEAVGLLAVLNSPRDYTQADLETVKRLARVYALAIRNKLSEKRKRADDEKHRQLLDSASDLIFSIRPDGRMLYVNRACERFGYKQEEVTGQQFTRFVHPADRQAVSKAFSEAVASGRTLPSLHYKLQKKDGAPVLVEQMSSISRLPDGELLIAGSIRDLSEAQRVEGLVKETREKYRALFETSSAAIMLADAATGMIIDANHNAELLTGRTLEELKTIHHTQLMAPSLREKARKSFRSLARQEHNLLAERELVRPDGSLVPVLMTSSRFKIDGRVVMQATFTDISALKASEKKYRALVDSTDTGYLILDSRGAVLDANEEYLRLTGRAKMADIIGRQVTEWTAWYDRDRNAGEVRKCLKKGLARNLVIDYERPGGDTVPVEVNATVLRTGTTFQIVALCRDISQRRTAEALLKESEERYRLLFENAADPVLITGEDGSLLAVNTAACRTYGYTREELLRLKISDVDAGGDPAALGRRVAGLLISSQIRLEARHKLKSGAEITVEGVSQAMTWGGRPATLNTYRDITARKKVEAALRESENRYRALFSASRDALMLLGAPDWRFTQANAATLQMFGVQNEAEFIKLSPWQLSPEKQPDGRPSAAKALDMLQRAMADGSAFFEWTHRRSGGPDFEAEVLLTRMEISGRKIIQATVRDISARKAMERQVLDSEHFLSQVLQNIPDMVFVKDARDLKLVRVNAAGERIFGAKTEELAGKSDYYFFPKEEADFFTAKDREVLASGRLLDIPEERIHSAEGEKLLHTKKIPIFGSDGKPLYLLGLSEDITERRRMEEELRQTEQRLELAMDQLNGVLWVLDKDLRFTMSRGQGLAGLGLTQDQIVGMTLEEFIKPVGPDNATVPAHRRALKGESVSYEERFLNRDYAIIISPLRGKDGAVSGIVGVGMDITERKRLETLLKQNEETLQQIFDTAEDAIFLKGVDGRYIKVNEAAGRLFGLDYRLMKGRRADDLFPAEFVESIKSDDMETILSGRTVLKNREREIPGGKIYLSVARTPIRGLDGGITGVLGIARDVTALKKMETELAIARASDALSSVARPMVHDFNNALTAISGYATLINDDMPDANPVKKEIGQIIKAVTRAAEISSKLQDFARNPRLDAHETQAPEQKPGRPKKKKKNQ